MPFRLVPANLVLIGALCAAGCRTPDDSIPPMNAGLSFVHPVQKPDHSALQRCGKLPLECKQRVHIFVCNGLDPFCLGNLNGFCHAVRSQGFDNIYFGQIWESADVERGIVDVRRCDPGAKIVLLGYSLGANDARRICNRLMGQGIRVDLLVYLGGDMIRDRPESRPANAQRVLNIAGHGFVITGRDLFFKGDDISGATNVRLDERHLLLPSRSAALDLFLSAVSETAECTPAK
jgi:hypothetical protein